MSSTQTSEREIAAEIEEFRTETLAEDTILDGVGPGPSSVSFEDWTTIEFWD